MADILILTLTLTLTLLSLCLLLLFLSNSHKTKLPPGPKPWPILGNLPDLLPHRRRLHRFLSDLSRLHGPLLTLHRGSSPIFVASTPASASAVLRTHDRSLCGRHVPAAFRFPAYTPSTFIWSTTLDERWKSVRSLCKSELFSSKALDAGSAERERLAARMVEGVRGRAGARVDVRESVVKVVYRMVGEMVLSADVLERAPFLREQVARAMELAVAPNLEDLWPRVFGGLDLQGMRRETAEQLERMYRVWDVMIDERRRAVEDEATKKQDFFAAVLRSGFDDARIKALFSDLFAAGVDTTTASIEWTLSELVKNAFAMAQVKQELDAVVGKDNQVRESHLPELAYLNACIKESLRLHPPVPLLLPHQSEEEDCEVMGHVIPKGCGVMVNVWAIGRDPDAWGHSPDEFCPERFINHHDECGVDFKGSHFKFLPFGSGRRACMGMPLGHRMIQLLVASLVHNFNWGLPDGGMADQLDMDDWFELTLERKRPLVLIPSEVGAC
ncbi:putative (S)-N-methylcoclaurine 3'-hydroxylase isozyme 2 [Acorus calamus]|uniref:(S)-N-methylcoclaurine 3'-hydroxylase isozyme 2 n=1 Tax=Acorus calamus TaxID=4465 RepID=A0AAV9F3W9_ACOCL|nr:putative (S)-N-methylcoclaurine 3'-hydroxylase isozyme 2 [Acorus calamus]